MTFVIKRKIDELGRLVLPPVDDKHDFAYMVLPVRIKTN